jgi:hypothetical protein
MRKKMTNYSHYINQNATITMTAAEFMFAIDMAKDSVAIDPNSSAYKAGRKDEQDYILDILQDPIHHNITSPDIHTNCYTCVLVKEIREQEK